MSELLEADQSYQTLPSMLYHMETRTSTEGHSQTSGSNAVTPLSSELGPSECLWLKLIQLATHHRDTRRFSRGKNYGEGHEDSFLLHRAQSSALRKYFVNHTDLTFPTWLYHYFNIKLLFTKFVPIYILPNNFGKTIYMYMAYIWHRCDQAIYIYINVYYLNILHFTYILYVNEY